MPRKMRNRRREQGFTLIELMIVVAIIAIIASMAVPNLMSSSLAANESVTTATLRSLATAQFRFKAMQLLDRDSSGSYEYGSLEELAGVTPVRGSGEMVDPNLLSVSFGSLDAQGMATRQGYRYAMYLPDASGNGVIAAGAALANVDPRNAEVAWTLLAWPTAVGKSGRTTFFVNQQGELLKCTEADYSGTTDIPPPGAALVGASPQQIVAGRLATGEVGADGFRWLTVQ